MGEVRQVRSIGERALSVAALALALTIGAFAPVAAGAIGATSFNMSPSSGPAGTVASVSGSGCSPGLLLQSNDRVTVAVATVPPTSVQLSVQANGSWSGSFTIPANAAAAPAAVTVLCVTDGLSSLLTIYTPKTFTVTGSIVPTTLPVLALPTLPPVTLPPVTLPGLPSVTLPSVTLPGSTPTTQPSNPSDPSDPSPGTSVSTPNDRIDDGTPGGGGGSGGSGGSDIGDGISSAAGGGGSGATAGADGKGGKKSAAGTRAAELDSPELSAAKSGKGSALGWLLWMLALSIPAGGAGFYLWMRHARRHNTPDLEADAT